MSHEQPVDRPIDKSFFMQTLDGQCKTYKVLLFDYKNILQFFADKEVILFVQRLYYIY